jgi:hypothetical protein
LETGKKSAGHSALQSSGGRASSRVRSARSTKSP